MDDWKSKLAGRRPGRSRVLAVAASVSLFWVTVSLIPVYNKYFFSKEYYPFPIATAGMQLGCVSASLAIINAAQHGLYYGADDSDGDVVIDGAMMRKSWIFGPHFWWKCKVVLPIGFLFGIKYGITNLGLHLVPAPTHLLLQSTDLVWTVLGAYFINGERSSLLGLSCLAGCVAGSFTLSLQVGQDVSAPALAMAVNLLSPMILGLCVATLRAACVELMDERNRVGGTVGSVELTAIKLCISSSVALVLAILFEGGAWGTSYELSDDAMMFEEGAGVMIDKGANWFDAFRNLPSSIKAGVLGGSVLILIFQVNCTHLTHLTSTLAVGLVGQLKIIPQWAVATLFSFDVHFRLTELNVVGAGLTMGSAAAFAINEYLAHSGEGSQSCRMMSDTEDDDDDTSGEEAETTVLMGTLLPCDGPAYGSVPAETTGRVMTLRV